MCKICGGKLSVSVHSEFAKCEACGNTAQIDAETLGKLRAVYDSAGRQMRRNTAVGYAEAIEQLQAISFVREAQSRIEDCEARLRLLREAEAKRAEAKAQAEKNDTKTGIVIVALLLLILLLAIAGAVYIGIHLYRGDLSPKAVAVIVGVVVAFALLTIASKLKS